ncbi:hypothetical protein KJ059_02320 [Myxococcota bacterium]|nr:hypothetical protein [Myxococcota bacterium]
MLLLAGGVACLGAASRSRRCIDRAGRASSSRLDQTGGGVSSGAGSDAAEPHLRRVAVQAHPGRRFRGATSSRADWRRSRAPTPRWSRAGARRRPGAA